MNCVLPAAMQKPYRILKNRMYVIHMQKLNRKLLDQNTTWFDDCLKDDDIYMITDAFGGVLIKDYRYSYPIWIEGKSRADIGCKKDNALKLIDLYVSP